MGELHSLVARGVLTVPSHMNEKEFHSVLSLPADRRYAYSIKRIADGSEIWGLSNDSGWVLFATDGGQETIPIWPHPDFAQACATGDWSDTTPQSIDLTTWMEKWIPGMIRDRRAVAVFPTADGKSAVISPERLRDDLQNELSLIE